MAVVTTRTELIEGKQTGIRTTLIWLLDNGLTTLESNITTALNTASAVAGQALEPGSDRTVPRIDVRALNDRVDEVA